MSPAAAPANPIAAVEALRNEFSRFSASFLADIDLLASSLTTKGAKAKKDAGYGDPADPRNKDGVNLTARGVEVAYRMFDEGKNRYQVAKEMQISFGGATYRHAAWTKEGGINRRRAALDE